MAAASFERVALVLQGGGALGAYHVGAYQALAEQGYEPDFLAGISIGAINAAIIAGNEREQRLPRLKAFWETVSRPPMVDTNVFGPWGALMNAAASMVLGQPNFFKPRLVSPLFAHGPQSATSFYDTAPLHETLLRFVDFDRINAKKTRIALGAVKIKTGELVFFDNFKQTIGPQHVIASGSLPPGFPPTRIGGELYWDGGCVSNTPLDAVLDAEPKTDSLVFVVDVIDAIGPEPNTLDLTFARESAIRYASRSVHHIEHEVLAHNLRVRLGKALAHLPEDIKREPQIQDLLDEVSDHAVHIVHIVQKPLKTDTSAASSDFARPTIAARTTSGYRDMLAAIAHSPWTASGGEQAAHVHHFRRGIHRPKATPKARRRRNADHVAPMPAETIGSN